MLADGTQLREGVGDQFGPIDPISASDILSVCLSTELFKEKFTTYLEKVEQCDGSNHGKDKELIFANIDFICRFIMPPCSVCTC